MELEQAAHLAILEEKDCHLTPEGGVRKHWQSSSAERCHTATRPDSADMVTEIEVVDGLAEIRDTWVSLSYAQKINAKKIIDDTATQMGLTVTQLQR